MNNNPVSMLFNLTDTLGDVVKNAIKSGVVICEDKKAAQRMEICYNCQDLDKSAVRCKLCGCYMNAKIRFDAAKCPADKW